MKLFNFCRWVAMLVLISEPNWCGAQESVKPIPKPPYVAAVPDDCHWTVTLEYPSSRKISTTHSERYPIAIDTIKTGNTKRVTLWFEDRTSQQFDQEGELFLTNSPSGVHAFTAAPDAPPYLYYTDGFLFIEPIEPTMFKGSVNYKGIECFYYKNNSTEVWVDAHSLLPVSAKSGGVMAHFQFLPKPNAPISLPPEELAILQKQEKAISFFRNLR
jgi:hypothetical protein